MKKVRKFPIVFVLVLLIVFTAGCVSQGNGTHTVPVNTSSPLASVTTEKPSSTSTTSTQGTGGETGKTPDLKELLSGVNGIESFTYTSSLRISMRVTLITNRTNQTDNLTIESNETGYIDFPEWSAWVNTTTVTPPAGASTTMERIIVDNVTYLRVAGRWIKVNDSRISSVVWKFNIVSLAREYLREKPDSIEAGETTILTYRLPNYVITPLAKAYFTAAPNSTVRVSDGVLKLYFRDGKLTGGEIQFNASARAKVNDSILGSMTILQDGTWEETFSVTSINKRIEVKAPST